MTELRRMLNLRNHTWRAGRISAKPIGPPFFGLFDGSVSYVSFPSSTHIICSVLFPLYSLSSHVVSLFGFEHFSRSCLPTLINLLVTSLQPLTSL